MNFKEDLLQQPQAPGVHEESSLIKDNQSMYNRKTLLRIKTEIENELNKMQESEPEEVPVKVDKRPVQRIKTYAVNDDSRSVNKTPIARLQTSMKLQHEREVLPICTYFKMVETLVTVETVLKAMLEKHIDTPERALENIKNYQKQYAWFSYDYLYEKNSPNPELIPMNSLKGRAAMSLKDFLGDT